MFIDPDKIGLTLVKIFILEFTVLAVVLFFLVNL